MIQGKLLHTHTQINRQLQSWFLICFKTIMSFWVCAEFLNTKHGKQNSCSPLCMCYAAIRGTPEQLRESGRNQNLMLISSETLFSVKVLLAGSICIWSTTFFLDFSTLAILLYPPPWELMTDTVLLRWLTKSAECSCKTCFQPPQVLPYHAIVTFALA